MMAFVKRVVFVWPPKVISELLQVCITMEAGEGVLIDWFEIQYEENLKQIVTPACTFSPNWVCCVFGLLDGQNSMWLAKVITLVLGWSSKIALIVSNCLATISQLNEDRSIKLI